MREKKEEKLEELFTIWFDKNFASCEKCGTLCRKKDMQCINIDDFCMFGGNRYHHYYCPIHRKPYDSIYFKNKVEVTKTGKPITNKK